MKKRVKVAYCIMFNGGPFDSIKRLSAEKRIKLREFIWKLGYKEPFAVINQINELLKKCKHKEIERTKYWW